MSWAILTDLFLPVWIVRGLPQKIGDGLVNHFCSCWGVEDAWFSAIHLMFFSGIYSFQKSVCESQTAKLGRFSLCYACSMDSDCHGMSAWNLKVMVCPYFCESCPLVTDSLTSAFMFFSLWMELNVCLHARASSLMWSNLIHQFYRIFCKLLGNGHFLQACTSGT